MAVCLPIEKRTCLVEFGTFAYAREFGPLFADVNTAVWTLSKTLWSGHRTHALTHQVMSGRVVHTHTHMHLSPSDITWYWPEAGDAVLLRRLPWIWAESNAQNLLPKICTKSPITRLVWQIDRRCLGLPGGFRGWPIQWNHAKCCEADPCCHGNEIWARRGDPVAYRPYFVGFEVPWIVLLLNHLLCFVSLLESAVDLLAVSSVVPLLSLQLPDPPDLKMKFVDSLMKWVAEQLLVLFTFSWYRIISRMKLIFLRI